MQNANLQLVLDRLAIHDVLVKYFHAIDHGSLAELESCFTADVEAVYDGVKISSNRDELLDFFRGKRAVPLKSDFRNLRHRMHFIANVTLSIRGDEASTETYALAHLIDEPDQLRIRTRALRYYDELRREAGEWRIYRRRHVVEWSKTERPDFLSGEIWKGWH